MSIEGMRRWGLIALLVVLAAGLLGTAYYFLHEPMDRRASRLLRRATAAQEEVHRAGVSESLQGEFDQASRLLEQAQADWDRKDYPACAARAEDSLRRFELLSGLMNRDFTGSGQIIALQGKVEIQRANQTQWEKAREKQALYNGDFVKTGANSSCEVLFSDQTVYRIGPDSLLEVHREARPGREAARGEVKVKVGQVNVYTALNPSSVVTDAARADVDRDSRVGVEVADDSSTTVAAYSGRARVTGSSGNQVDLGSLQAVSAAPAGTLGQRFAVPGRPVLELPPANSLVNLDSTDRVSLRWRAVPGSLAYDLQVSRSRLFNQDSLEFPTSRRESNTATLKILRPGTYFWRVATVGANRVRSEWSDPRPFKAFTGSRVQIVGDTTPPRLEVAKPTQMGSMVIVQGVTEPGATVTINGEAVEVAGDGTFRKALQLNKEGLNTIVIRATDPAGNVAEDKKQVFVEVD
ncbi:MAG: FecR domain-containing protein [Acidobacteriota bacterium]